MKSLSRIENLKPGSYMLQAIEFKDVRNFLFFKKTVRVPVDLRIINIESPTQFLVFDVHGIFQASVKHDGKLAETHPDTTKILHDLEIDIFKADYFTPLD